MAYILKQLLAVRHHRENKARSHLERSKTQLEQARARKRSKERELTAYHQWRLHEEARLFSDLQREPVNVQDLLCFTGIVQNLRSDQASKARQVDEAAKQKLTAEDALQSARQAHAAAYRQEAKIKAHRKSWREAHRLELERAAENEMDAAGRFAAHGRKEAF